MGPVWIRDGVRSGMIQDCRARSLTALEFEYVELVTIDFSLSITDCYVGLGTL
jgi:hypothetical protein